MNQKHLSEQQSFRFRRLARKAYSAFNSMHRVVSIGVVAGCTLVSATTVSAQSGVDKQQPQLMEKELDEVLVTAALSEQPLNQTAKIVSVITREQISQAPVQSIQDLLVYIAGVDVIQKGGHGVQADISIRGGSADQTAILLNGINLSNSQTGHYSFDIPINLSDIERIEIIQGPSSLIYGVSAFSGGINIITKKDADTKGYVRLGAGMNDLYEMEARGTAKAGITSNQLSFGYNTSGGYIANSDYDMYNALWQTRLNLENKSKVDFQLGYNNKKYGANTFYSAMYPQQYEQTDTYLGSVKGTFGSDFKILPSLYWTRHHDQFDLTKGSPKGRNYHRNDMYGGNLTLQYKSKLGLTAFSSDLRKEEILSSKLGEALGEPHGAYYTNYDSRTNTSVAMEHSTTIDQFIFSGGVLMNHNTLLKGKYRFYPSVSLAYLVTSQIRISSSWSKATRMPTFTDFSYTTDTHIGNEALLPEKSESVDLGIKYRNHFMSAYANGYLMWGRNVIDWVRKSSTDKLQAWNHTKLDRQGVEVGVKFRLAEALSFLGESSAISLDYVRMHQTRNEADLESNHTNYLRDKFTAQFNHQIYGGLSAGWYFRFQKRMGEYTKVENGTQVGKRGFPSYSTLDLKLNYKYRDFDFNLTMNNMYDTDYYDVGNIPQAGFWLIGGVSYTIR